MGCRTNGMLLVWICAFWSTLLVDLTHAFETDADNNAALEGMKDPSTGLTMGIPFSFTCPRQPRVRHAKVLCGGKMCMVQCSPGYFSNPKNAFVYICNLSTGVWRTLPPGKQRQWSDCVKRRPSLESKILNAIKPVKQETKIRVPEKGDFEIGNESRIPYGWEEEEENMTLG